MLGHWENYEDMELKLTLDELVKIVDKARDIRFESYKFAASLKGINLDDPEDEELTIADIENRVAARQAGIDEDDFALMGLGVAFETE